MSIYKRLGIKRIDWDTDLIKMMVKDLGVCEKVLKRNIKMLCVMLDQKKKGGR